MIQLHPCFAAVVKLAYTRDLKSLARKGVRVRPPPAAHVRGVAQMARAPALGAGGPQFESGHPDTFYTNSRIEKLSCLLINKIIKDMTEADQAMYIKLRQGTRNLLARFEILSNAAVNDSWIVDQLRALTGLAALNENVPEEQEESLDLFKRSLIGILVDSGSSINTEKLRSRSDPNEIVLVLTQTILLRRS